MKKDSLKVALVHDWLNGMRGGEKVLELFIKIFPDADIFTLHSELDKVSPLIKNRKVKHSFIQCIPGRKRFYRHLLPLFPLAVRLFDFKGYDLVVSTSHCAVKNIDTCRVPHISYCFSPMRYLWSLKEDYFQNKLKRLFLEPIFALLKKWDFKGTKRVDCFFAVSETIRKRIDKCYQRKSVVLYPPCDLQFTAEKDKDDYFLVLSALTPYKKVDIAIEAANRMNVKLKIAGTGPEMHKLKKMAGPKCEFLGWVSEDKKKELLRKAKALIFPGFEDFGIVPLEAMACFTPVIGFGQGGLTETVVSDKTGVFFTEQSADSLINAMEKFSKYQFDPQDFASVIENFSEDAFIQRASYYIERYLEEQRWED